jgi:cytochrome bd-type quinol oxidase subunit 1
MPVSGDLAAKNIAERQPEKLAAMESLFVTQPKAPLIIGGIPNEETQEVKMAIEIPGLLSFLAFGNLNAEVKGLDQFPRNDDIIGRKRRRQGNSHPGSANYSACPGASCDSGGQRGAARGS